MQTRLYRLEAAVKRHEQVLHTNDPLQPENRDNDYFQNHESMSAINLRAQQSSVNDLNGHRSADIQEVLQESGSTDGMATTYINEEESGYFGELRRRVKCSSHVDRRQVQRQT